MAQRLHWSALFYSSCFSSTECERRTKEVMRSTNQRTRHPPDSKSPTIASSLLRAESGVCLFVRCLSSVQCPLLTVHCCLTVCGFYSVDAGQWMHPSGSIGLIEEPWEEEQKEDLEQVDEEEDVEVQRNSRGRMRGRTAGRIGSR